MDDQPIDLGALAIPPARFDAAVAHIAQRAQELRRFRRAVIRRGVTALVLATAAGIALWLSAPDRAAPGSNEVLDWATRGVTAEDVLSLGGSHAQ